MDVSSKIKSLRTERGWSQEKMAEKLGVSRQAITKWETGAGTPDIENLAAIAQLFGVSTDSLLFGSGADGEGAPEKYESVTSVDIAEEKNYDIKVGCARSVRMRTVDSEKVVVRLESETIEDLARAFQVALDTEGRNFDIDVKNRGVVADALARRDLDVAIDLPQGFADTAELEIDADECRIEHANMDLEVGGQAAKVLLEDVEGHVELDMKNDTEIWARDLRGKLDVNQIGAVSTLHLDEGTTFAAETRGRLGKRTLQFTRDGKPADLPSADAADADLSIEVAGTRVELTVDIVTAG